MFGLPQGGLQATITKNIVENNQSVYDAAGIFIL